MKKKKSNNKKKSLAKTSKPKKTTLKRVTKKELASAPTNKVKLKKVWQDASELEEDEKREEDDSFADEQEPKLENLDDALLDTGDDDEDAEGFHDEDAAF